MELTSRELATVILFSALVALAVVLHKGRRDLARQFVAVLRLLASRRLWPVFVGFLAYAAAVVALASRLGWWLPDLLKDTVIIVIFTGIPFLMRAASAKDGGLMVRRLVLEVGGFAALALFYLNLASFPLWGELLFQAALGLLVLLEIVSRRDPNARTVRKVLLTLIAVVVVWAFAYTTTELAKFTADEWLQQARALALSVLLPMAFLPAVYPFAYFAACEATLYRLALHNNRKKPPLRVRFAYVAGCHLRLSYAAGFAMLWLPALATQRTYRSAAQVMKNYRAAVRGGAEDVREHQRQLKDRAGVIGPDVNGRWRDRREFHETKELLRGLAYAQMGQARNNNDRYHGDPLSLMFASNLKNLPEDPGVQASTSSDRKAWLAWRKTAGGYYFGAGGRLQNIDEIWYYEGQEPPSGFPSTDAAGWKTDRTNDSGEWSRNDALPAPVRAPEEV